MAKNFVVDFYVVNVSGEDSFQNALTTLQALPEDESRNMNFQDAPVRLARIARHQHTWEGDMMKIRLGEAAVIASLNGHIAPVSIDDDTGLGETTAFLYDDALNVIAIQRNRTAVSAAKVAGYIETLGGLANAVIFVPILRQEVYEKLRGMHNISRFHIKVATPADLTAMREDVPNLGGALDVAEEFQSPTLELVLSLGKHKGSLNKTPLVRTVHRLIRRHDADSESVKKIEVSGRYDDDSKTDLLDLIKERLHVSVPIEVTPLPDEFYNRRRTALRAALDENRTEIRRIVREMQE